MARIYLPMLKAGRVRYNAEKTCMKHDFSKEIQQKAMVSLEEILRQYSAATLKEAIEKQAAWLENDEKRRSGVASGRIRHPCMAIWSPGQHGISAREKCGWLVAEDLGLGSAGQ